MTLQLSSAENAALRRFLAACDDAESLSADEWVLDLYEIETPLSLNLVLQKDGSARVDGAAALLYDEAMDGWYMGERTEDAAIVREALVQAGALDA